MSTNDLDKIDFQNTTQENIQRVQKMMYECMRHRGGPAQKSEYLKKLQEKREDFYNNQKIWEYLYLNNGVDLKMAQCAWEMGPKKAWEVLQGVEKNSQVYQQVAKEYRKNLRMFSLEYDNLFLKKREKFEKIEEWIEKIARNVMDENKNSKEDIGFFIQHDWICCYNLMQSYMYKKNFVSNECLVDVLEEALIESVLFDNKKQWEAYMEKSVKNYVTSGANLNCLEDQEKTVNILEIIFEGYDLNQETLYNLFKMGIKWEPSKIWNLNKKQKESGDEAWNEYQTLVQNNTITRSIEDHTQERLNTSVRKI